VSVKVPDAKGEYRLPVLAGDATPAEQLGGRSCC